MVRGRSATKNTKQFVLEVLVLSLVGLALEELLLFDLRGREKDTDPGGAPVRVWPARSGCSYTVSQGRFHQGG